MPSAKQLKARKLFAKRVKRGDFRKAISKTKKSELPQRITTKPKAIDSKDYEKGYLTGKVGGITQKNMKAWLIQTIKTREKNPKNYSSDYSRGELRGYKEALAQLTGKPTRFGR